MPILKQREGNQMEHPTKVKLQYKTIDTFDCTVQAENFVEFETVNDSSADIDERLIEIQAELDCLSSKIGDLTNQATKADHIAAVASGIVAGLIDIFFVGKFDLQAGYEWSSERINSFVGHVARNHGYNGNDFKGAIRFLEKFGAPSDSVTSKFGYSRQHHLRDFAHHASPSGLLFSMLTQFTGKAYGTNKAGKFITVALENTTCIGKDLHSKFTLGLVHWMLHLASDMAGSSGAIGKGTGIPGPILSLVKMLSTSPIFKDKDGINQLSKTTSELFNGTLLAERDAAGRIISAHPMDLRGELGFLQQLGKQAIPIIANEALVRGFYFVSRLIEELKAKKKLKDIDWRRTAPFKNATITRMLTISTGTFTVMDQIGAAIGGAINSKASWAEFGRQALLRVNFVGIGRFTISLGAEAVQCYKKRKRTKEQMKLQVEYLQLISAKLYHGESLLWAAAKDADESISYLYEAMDKVASELWLNMSATRDKFTAIEQLDVAAIEAKNPGLTDELLDILK